MMRTLIAVAVAAAFAVPAQSQDKPAPPPAWHQGKPPAQTESKLAPHPGKMTETPASEIPVSKLKLPAGFKAVRYETSTRTNCHYECARDLVAGRLRQAASHLA